MCHTTPFTGINRMPHQTNNHIKYCYHMTKQFIGCPLMCNWSAKSINVFQVLGTSVQGLIFGGFQPFFMVNFKTTQTTMESHTTISLFSFSLLWTSLWNSSSQQPRLQATTSYYHPVMMLCGTVHNTTNKETYCNPHTVITDWIVFFPVAHQHRKQHWPFVSPVLKLGSGRCLNDRSSRLVFIFRLLPFSKMRLTVA